MEWHAGFTLDIRFDSEETLKRVGKESAVVLANHGSDIDWLLGWVVAHKLNILGVSLWGLQARKWTAGRRTLRQKAQHIITADCALARP